MEKARATPPNKTLKLTAARQVGFARHQGLAGGRRQLRCGGVKESAAFKA